VQRRLVVQRRLELRIELRRVELRELLLELMQVTVVGAGVIGLVTALALEERGHVVRVVAATTGVATTSAIAGAVWFPYRVGPPARVSGWAARTRAWLEQLARDAPAAGVDLLVGYELADDDVRPWWATADLAVARAPAPVVGAPPAWRFVAPRAQPSLLLPYLAARLRAHIERRAVVDLAAEPGDAVVNCAGLGARELAGDDALIPLFGQIAIAAPGGADLGVTITDDRDPEALFYIIPRRDELVLGGCSRPYPPGAAPLVEPELTARIVQRAAELGIAIGDVRGERVGLRPFRVEVRLERDAERPRVIHNYGHGGAGFTLCRGCAEEIVALVAAG
jgi:D-amino-acid oxidase